MTTHRASCRCGALTAVVTGEPVRISVCHCLDCQRRSGSAFSAQVRFSTDRVSIFGESSVYETTGDNGRWGRFRFCPACGNTIAYEIEFFPELIAIPLGAFDEPYAFAPAYSVWEERKHEWVEITSAIEHSD